MEFKSETEKFFECMGENVTVVVESVEHKIKALIQPMRYKNKMYLESQRTELGFKDGECFLYLGPAIPDLSGKEELAVVKTADRCFNVSRADRIVLKGVTQYIWAVLTLKYKDGDFNAD